MSGFRNFGLRSPGSGWQNIGGGAWQHPGPLQWGGQTYPYGGMIITRRSPRPTIKPWSPPIPNQRQIDIAQRTAARRAIEQAQRQADQARQREQAAREARERAARERQLQEQQQRIRDQQRRGQREQQQRQRALQEQQRRQLEQQREQQRRLLEQQREQQRHRQEQAERQRQQQLQLAREQEHFRQIERRDRPIEPSLISPLDFIGAGGLGAKGVRAGSSSLSKFLSGMLARRATRGIVSGPFGSMSRKVIEKAMSSSGPTVRVVTRLTQSPQIGRALSVATGEGAELLANAARGGGRLFTADIPRALLVQFEHMGLVVRSTTNMGGVTATELRFLPAASEFIIRLLR